MVNESASTHFINEAVQIGQWLANSALRHRGKASWLSNNPRTISNKQIVNTINSTLAGGAAGIGWFLARLAAITHDKQLTEVAIEALRNSIDGGSALCNDRRYGWYEGAFGVSWAAIDAGFVLSNDELINKGIELANEVVSNPPTIEHVRPALVGGMADVVSGVLAITVLLRENGNFEYFESWADSLIEALTSRNTGTVMNCGQMSPGLAHGTTGIALSLASWSLATGQDQLVETIERIQREERAWFEPGLGWVVQPTHESKVEEYVVDWSWCAGASGIGLARLASYVTTSNLADLADLTAAVEIVREVSAIDDGNDASLWQGTSGAIDFLMATGVLLSQPEHITAAQRIGQKLLHVRRKMVRKRTGFGLGQNPTLLFGLAGYGVVMLRLYDCGLTPTPALPLFMMQESTF